MQYVLSRIQNGFFSVLLRIVRTMLSQDVCLFVCPSVCLSIHHTPVFCWYHWFFVWRELFCALCDVPLHLKLVWHGTSSVWSRPNFLGHFGVLGGAYASENLSDVRYFVLCVINCFAMIPWTVWSSAFSGHFCGALGVWEYTQQGIHGRHTYAGLHPKCSCTQMLVHRSHGPKRWPDPETWVLGCSRSLKMAWHPQPTIATTDIQKAAVAGLATYWHLPRQQWSLLNRFCMEHGHCGDCRRKRQLKDTDLCPCGETQMMLHIVKSCPLTKLNGGLSWLHSVDEDTVSLLTNHGSWHVYKKQKETENGVVRYTIYDFQPL